MPALICLFGMLIAALFAIVAYGTTGAPTNGPTNWIDLGFWAIVVASAAPLVLDWALEVMRRTLPRLYRGRCNSGTETETV